MVAQKGNVEVLQLLLQAGADKEQQAKVSDWNNIFVYMHIIISQYLSLY
jgi:hypothetical protein